MGTLHPASTSFGMESVLCAWPSILIRAANPAMSSDSKSSNLSIPLAAFSVRKIVLVIGKQPIYTSM